MSTPDSLKVNKYDSTRDSSNNATEMNNFQNPKIPMLPQEQPPPSEYHDEINNFRQDGFNCKNFLDDLDLESAYASFLPDSNGQFPLQNKIFEQIEKQHQKKQEQKQNEQKKQELKKQEQKKQGQKQQGQKQQEQKQQEQQHEFNQDTSFQYNHLNSQNTKNTIHRNNSTGFCHPDMQDLDSTQNMAYIPNMNMLVTNYHSGNDNSVNGNGVNGNGVAEVNVVAHEKPSTEKAENSKPTVVIYSERFRKEQSNGMKRKIKSPENKITTLVQNEQVANDKQQPKGSTAHTNDKKKIHKSKFDLGKSLSKHGLVLNIEKLGYDSNTADLTETQKKILNFYEVSTSVRKNICTPITKLYDVLHLKADTDHSIKLGVTNELVKYYSENKNPMKKSNIPEHLQPLCFIEDATGGRGTKKTDETVLNLQNLVDVVNNKDTPGSQYIETINYDIKANKASNLKSVSNQMLDFLKDDIHNFDMHEKNKQKKSNNEVDNNDVGKKMVRRKAGEVIEWKPLPPAVVLGYRKGTGVDDTNEYYQYKTSSCLGVLNLRNLRAWKRSKRQ
ncbi:unnamed protein product [[Candida] boidinii]|nr:unnamed protein product [[Candida] boidinii]